MEITSKYRSLPVTSMAKSLNSADGSAPGEIRIKIGSIAIVSLLKSFFKFNVSGEISLIPNRSQANCFIALSNRSGRNA